MIAGVLVLLLFSLWFILQAYRHNWLSGSFAGKLARNLIGRSQVYRHDQLVDGSQAYQRDHSVSGSSTVQASSGDSRSNTQSSIYQLVVGSQG